jgi:hypothetical protein
MRYINNCINFSYKTESVNEKYKEAGKILRDKYKAKEFDKSEYRGIKKELRLNKKSDKKKAIVKVENYIHDNNLKSMNSDQLTELLSETTDKDYRNAIKHRRKIAKAKPIINGAIDVASATAGMATMLTPIPGALPAKLGINAARMAGTMALKDKVNRS